MKHLFASRLTSLLLLFPLQSTSQQTQDAETAKRFVQRVYADYANSDWQHQDERQEKFYTRQLLRLIVADRTAHPGEAGNLDWDPICDCQDAGDPGDLKVQSITLAETGSLSFKAVVAFMIVKEPRMVTLSLLKTRSGWRIDDVSEKDMPSLRALLNSSHRK